MSLTFVNFITPKAGAEHELLFNEPGSADCHNKVIGVLFLNLIVSLFDMNVYGTDIQQS
jgi:hypothetical protein